MNKLFALIVLIASQASAQNWQTISPNDLGLTTHPLIVTWYGNGEPFRINPFTNEFCLGNYGEFHIVNSDGTVKSFFDDTHPNYLSSNTRVINFGFSSTNVYMQNISTGVIKIDGSNLFYVLNNNDTDGLNVINDTVYALSRTQDSYAFLNGVNLFNFTITMERIDKINNVYWFSPNDDSSINYHTNTFTLLNAVDIDFLLSNKNYHFRKKRNSDSLYVASDLGFSIASDSTFYDTLTINNCPTMPYPKVLEFEFDSNDNIWAMFGDDNENAICLAYYSNGVWDKLYTESNSPIDFEAFRGLEIDTFDNVWVADKKLHTLKEYEIVQWLELKENTKEVDFAVYPNPSANGIIQLDYPKQYTNFTIKTIEGKVFNQFSNSEKQITLPSGVYFIELMGDSKETVAIRKVIVN